jgi:hypothetical protein
MRATAVQSSSGQGVSASSDLFVGQSYDATSHAAAAANSVEAANAFGFTAVAATQSNTAPVTASGYVTLDGDFLGLGAASASGVGNSVAVANVGSDTMIEASQTNAGDIGATSALAGNGGAGESDASAVGNIVTGALCAACGDSTITAATSQTSSGAVRAHAVVQAQQLDTASVRASAVGNAAVYSITGD